jgi:hypothetical protein
MQVARMSHTDQTWFHVIWLKEVNYQVNYEVRQQADLLLADVSVSG